MQFFAMTMFNMRRRHHTFHLSLFTFHFIRLPINPYKSPFQNCLAEAKHY